jgi:hypothetical protein
MADPRASYWNDIWNTGGNPDPSQYDPWAAQNKYMKQFKTDIGQQGAKQQSGLFSGLAEAGYDPTTGGAMTSGLTAKGGINDWMGTQIANEQNRTGNIATQQAAAQKQWIEQQAEANRERQAAGSWGWLKGLSSVAQAAAPLAMFI